MVFAFPDQNTAFPPVTPVDSVKGPWNKWGGSIAPFMPRKPLMPAQVNKLPAVPGDVGRRPLSIPRDCQAASVVFRSSLH